MRCGCLFARVARYRLGENGLGVRKSGQALEQAAQGSGGIAVLEAVKSLVDVTLRAWFSGGLGSVCFAVGLHDLSQSNLFCYLILCVKPAVKLRRVQFTQIL